MTHRFRVAPFALERCVTCGQTFRWSRDGDGWIGADGDAWFRVYPSFDVESNFPIARFEQYFGLAEDLAETATEIARRAPELKPYLSAHHGLRMVRSHDPNEVLFSFLCTANNHIARITPMVQRLSTYGEAKVGAPLPCFPAAARLAQVTEAELRAAGFGYRARTIPLVAHELIRRGPGWLSSQGDAPYREAVRELQTLPSVGPKLADCVALFGLGFGEAVPVDTHIWQLGTRLYFPEWQGLAITARRYEAVAEALRGRLGSFAGRAHQFLFVDNLDRRRGKANV